MSDFKDLSCYRKIDIPYIPEIRLSNELKHELSIAWEEEEKKEGCASFFESTTRVEVKNSNNNLFFANQWWYLAVLSKDYAEALNPYINLYEEKVKGQPEIVRLLASHSTDSEQIKAILPKHNDRERFYKFFVGDKSFCEGKNAKDDSGRGRQTKDVFSSRVLKKFNIPDSSSGYLGDIIFYLSKRPDLYEKLEKEVMRQVGNSKNAIELPLTYTECAKAVVDYIYEIDGFKRIANRFVVMDSNIKIDTSNTDGLLPQGNWLRYMFARPESGMFDPEERVFGTEYTITVDEIDYTCKLTTEWVGTEVTVGAQGNNYLQALIILVNHYYADVIRIVYEAGKYYLEYEFSLRGFPAFFDRDYYKRYIVSLLAKPFVILTGNSGTGKTRIAEQFANYLEVRNEIGEKNWLKVPVGADWTDNVKVLGFYNPLANDCKGKYEATDILRLLERANANPEIPFFLILDEMNLSHVERYFSDFLSHMESRNSCFELEGYRSIPYPDNLFVIGTVNIDETTYMFSPKVLDRANVIEFNPSQTQVLNLFDETERNDSIVCADPGVAKSFLRLAKIIRNGESQLNAEQLSKTKAVFNKVYEITQKQKNGYEFAYRTVKEIKRYLSADQKLSDQWDDQNLYKAIDEQIIQKVLPKIHGNKKEIGNMLKELKEFCTSDSKQLILSKEKIEQMEDKLDRVQYASFI